MCIKRQAMHGLSMLDTMRQENVLLKDLLSSRVQREISKNCIKMAEHFQQKFIENDQIVDLLRYEINTLIIRRYNRFSKQENALLHKRFQLLTRDIRAVRHDFDALKSLFETYFLG